jgi:hypothetical protein
MNINECRPSVQRFAILMEEELRRNDWKGGWMGMKRWQVSNRLNEELRELDSEVLRSGRRVVPERVIKESVDVANFAMFMVDIHGGLNDPL